MHIQVVISAVELKVLELKTRHKSTWRDKPEWWWLLGLLEEVVELVFALVGLHRGPVDWELTQIAAIAMNWLEHRGTRVKRSEKTNG